MSGFKRSSRRKAGIDRPALAFGILTICVGFAVAVSSVFGLPNATASTDVARSDANDAADDATERVVLELWRPSDYSDAFTLNGLGVRYDSDAPNVDEALVDDSETLVYSPAEFADEPNDDSASNDVALDDDDSDDVLDWGVAQEDPNWREDIELTDYEVAQFAEKPVRIWDFDARESDGLDDSLADYDVFDQLHVESLLLENGSTMYQPQALDKVVATTAVETDETADLSQSISAYPNETKGASHVVSSEYIEPQESAWSQGAVTASSFATSRVY